MDSQAVVHKPGLGVEVDRDQVGLYSFGNLNLLASKDLNTEVVLQVNEMKVAC